MLHVRFALRRAAAERVATALFHFFFFFFRPWRDVNGSRRRRRRRQVCAYVWLGDQFPMGTTYSLFYTRDGRTSPSSKTHHTGLWNVLLSRPVGASQQLHVERKSYMSFYLRYMQICSNRCYVFLCVSFCFVCFSYQCKSTPFAGLKGQEVTHNLPPPNLSVTPHTVARPHGLA